MVNLRPRKSHVSYVQDPLSEADTQSLHLEVDSEGSQREPAQVGENIETALSEDEAYREEDAEGDMDDDKDSKTVTAKGQRKRKKSVKESQNLSLSKDVSSARASQGLPAYDHRHRPVPLYWLPSRVERLSEQPSPFLEAKTVITNNYMSSKVILDKLGRASGRNFGPGPIWEYMEDRSWWKESKVPAVEEAETEGTRRPKVFDSVNVDATLRVIEDQEAKSYLPSDNNGSGQSSIKCLFGYPVKESVRELKIFDSLNMSELLPESKAQVFNAGAPVWGIDWCPIYIEDRPHRSYKQYIAVAPLPSASHSPRIGVKCTTSLCACIQIWSYSSKISSSQSEKGKQKENDGELDTGVMKCELVLCVESGPAQEIKWCPLPSNDAWNTPLNRVRKLGLLAGTFEDGSLCIYTIPDPEDLGRSNKSDPIYVKMKPIFRAALEETFMWCLDWANSERLAVGCTNGAIAVYDVVDVLSQEQSRDILPSHYIPSVHQTAIRSIAWIRSPDSLADGRLHLKGDPNLLSTGGYDGCVMLTDLKDGLSYLLNNRTRDVVYSVTYSKFSTGVVSTDLDFTVKSFFLTPSMLGRGHIVMEAGGPVWSIHTSDYHPIVATGSADGAVQTTNMMRSPRRALTSPFLFHKIYQLDYNRKRGEYRMLEQFLPQEVPDRSSTAKKKKKTDSESEAPQGTGAWPAEVSVTRVVWNNGCGIGRAPLLASATVSGLCRIDWLLGFFLGGSNPYNGIEYIRNEIESYGDNELNVDENE